MATVTPLIQTLTSLCSCPLTGMLMNAPVTDSCGHTFEQIAIESHLECFSTCPISSRPILIADLTPNRMILDVIEAIKDFNPPTASFTPTSIVQKKPTLLPKHSARVTPETPTPSITTSQLLFLQKLQDILSCRISLEYLHDSVIDPCGHTFERTSIHAWVLHDSTCPISRARVSPRDFRTNLLVQELTKTLSPRLFPPLPSPAATKKNQTFLAFLQRIILKIRQHF